MGEHAGREMMREDLRRAAVIAGKRLDGELSREVERGTAARAGVDIAPMI